MAKQTYQHTKQRPRAYQAALDSARYVDDEVEGLLNVNGGARFELDRFLSPPPELADGWLGGSSMTAPQHHENTPRHPTPPSRARDTSNRLINTARAVVANTPLRSNARGAQEVGTPSNAGLNSPGLGRGTEGRVGDGVSGQTTNKPRSEPQRNVVDTGQGERETVGKNSGEGPTARASGGMSGEGLARAWGLKDPTVARAMMKRAKRMRKFQNGEARREKLKDPDVRFDVFARNAGGRRMVSAAYHIRVD